MNERERVASVLRDVQVLPTLPDVAVKLLELGEKPTTSVGDLAKLVERDMALATRVLRLVNSSFFGVGREVTSIQHALMILGVAHLRSVVLSGAAANLFERSGTVGTFSRAEFWKHTVAVAAISRALAVRTKIIEPEVAFTAGLIHDMGKVVEDRYLHSGFEKIIAMLDDPTVTMHEAENAVLGVSHAEIGRHLGNHWNLPEILREAVGYHHHPADAPEHAPAAALVAVADAMARDLEIGSGGGANCPVGEDTLALCKLTSELYVGIKDLLAAELAEQVSTFAQN